MLKVGDKGRVFEKIYSPGKTVFGWMDAEITALNGDHYLTVTTKSGTFFMLHKEFEPQGAYSASV